MSPSITKPRVTVEQVYAAADAVRVAPTQPVVILAPCFDILRATQEDGAVNPNALASFPAYALASVGPYAVGGTTISVRITNGPIQTITLPGTGSLTAAQIARAVNVANVGLVAYDIGGRVLFTTATGGSGVSIEFTAIDAAFGLLTDTPYKGNSTYDNNSRSIPFPLLPDPFGRMDDLDIQEDSIAAYVLYGGELRELRQDGALLGTSQRLIPLGTHVEGKQTYNMRPWDDGRGQSTTKQVYAHGTSASGETGTTGNSDVIVWTASGVDGIADGQHGNYHGEAGNIISVGISAGVGSSFGITTVLTPGSESVTIQLTTDGGGVIDAAMTLEYIIDQVNNDASAKQLIKGALGTGMAGSTVISGTDNVTLTGGIDPLDFKQAADIAKVDGTVNFEVTSGDGLVLAGDNIIFRIDGGQEFNIVFDQSYDKTNFADMLTFLNTAMGGGTAWQSFTVGGLGPGLELIQLSSTEYGMEGVVELVGGTALTKLFGTVGVGKYYGNPYPVYVGDKLYRLGTYYGQVVRVLNLEIGDQTFNNSLLEVSEGIQYTIDWDNWYITAESIRVDGPNAELNVDTGSQVVTARQAVLYGADGMPVSIASYPVYLAYKALRKDVTNAATTRKPSLISYAGTTALSEDMDLSSDNPLGLGLLIAMASAPDRVVYGLGVDDVSADEPDGTYLSYLRAFEFLETRNVWLTIIYTKDEDVHLGSKAHAEAMSTADNGKWRIMAFTEAFPEEETPPLLGSGDGSSGEASNKVEINPTDLNVAVELTQLGLNPTEALSVADGIFIKIDGQAGKWLISGVDINNIVTLVSAFTWPDNDDGFYSTTLPDTFIDKIVSLYQRGAVIDQTQDLMEAIAAKGERYGTRRCLLTMPDTADVSNASGGEELLSTFYSLCALAGEIASSDPAEPMSDKVLAGTNFVYNSNDRFPETNGMDIAAGGGIFWLYNDNGTVRVWRQITTDTTLLERMELSVVRQVDYVSLVCKETLRPFLNKKITENYLAELSVVTESLHTRLVDDEKVVADLRVLPVDQDEDNPTIIKIVLLIVPLYPSVEIQVELNIQRSLI